MSDIREINFDGLVSPLHNYAGLSPGNIASQNNADASSNPHQAAMQGLDKMLRLSEQGLGQALIPPQRRPAWQILRNIGFSGSDQEILETAAQTAPHLLASCCSSSAMWTANAATIAPAHDTTDGKMHLVPANLASNFHRSIEPPQTAAVLKQIFPKEDYFCHHPPLPNTPLFHDEGAANHTRLSTSHDTPGLHLFVYGADTQNPEAPKPKRFPARQTLESCRALARLLHLPEERYLFLQQSPEAIDAGVFHNDVISTGNENAFLYHEKAFLLGRDAIASLEQQFELVCSSPLHSILVPDDLVPIEDAVKSYLFNSQLVTMPGGSMTLIAPGECERTDSVNRFIHEHLLPGDNPVTQVIFMDLRQSMRNGGGPACLRLRVLLNQQQRQLIPPGLWMNAKNYASLAAWVDRHYPHSLCLSDLTNPELHAQVQHAFNDLESILQLQLPLC